MGFLRPAILIPAGMLTGFPPEQIECFLLHELAHIRRWDYFVNLLQSIAETCYFTTPPSGGSPRSSSRSAKTAVTTWSLQWATRTASLARTRRSNRAVWPRSPRSQLVEEV
jgi:hypothetical protein